MDSIAAVWIAGMTFAALVIAYAVRITWAIGSNNESIRSDMEERFAERDRNIAERDTRLHREIGETFAAMRGKIHEMEMWNRDHFVRKESFELVVGRIEKSIEKMGDKLEEKLDQMAATNRN